MKDCDVNLNVHEIGILLTALQTLDTRDEKFLAKDYGSSEVLYNKLFNIWACMDKSNVNLRNDVVPSF